MHDDDDANNGVLYVYVYVYIVQCIWRIVTGQSGLELDSVQPEYRSTGFGNNITKTSFRSGRQECAVPLLIIIVSLCLSAHV